MASQSFILSADMALKKMQRIAYEIVERNVGEQQIILAGIKENGLIISRIIKSFLKDVFKGEIIVIEIDIDKKNPKKISLKQERAFDNSVIIIVDDVANTGKTLMYALHPFLTFYPKKIQALVLVERSHKEFPVSADYVGLSISTGVDEKIIVETEGDKILGARLENQPANSHSGK